MSAEGSTLKKGARIVLIVDLPGVAAGTPGKVGRSIGVKSTRYRVKFENGVEALSVAEGKLVSPAAWEYIKDNQIASHNEQPGPSVAAAVPISAASAPSTAPTQPPAASPQPPAAAKPEPVPPPPPPQPSTGNSQAATSSGADDPRLAEFFAKSRAAKKALGIDVDAEPAAAPPAPAEETTVEPEQAPEPTAASDASPPESATAQEPEAAASPEPPASETEVGAPIELPDGYYPPNNRVADLLSSFRGN